MQSQRILLVLSLLVLSGCQLIQGTPTFVPNDQKATKPSIITPVPAGTSHLEPTANSAVARVWANTGEDKVTRDELRSSMNPAAVLNSIWDGSTISIFGAKNEVVGFNLILEAPEREAIDVELDLTPLKGPGTDAISGWPPAEGDLFDYRGRNTELFFVRYLEIKGISTDLFFAGYDYDERHLPPRCRRPYDETGEGVGGWQDRPCHNRFYPDIAVPLELHSPFVVPAASNQSIWVDIYIPASTQAGLYTGVLTIQEAGQTAWQIPIELIVLNFELPDLPVARTMLYLSPENIADRYLGTQVTEVSAADQGDLQRLVDRHFQLAHRHKLSLFDPYTPVQDMDLAWKRRLDGSLFTSGNGYAGVGAGVGNNLYVIGAYGDWPWRMGSQEDMWGHTDRWVGWFQRQSLTTPTDFFLYLIDESDDYAQIETWARWIETNPGIGRNLMSMATIDLPQAVESTPSLDIPTSWASLGIPTDWEQNAALYHNAEDKAFFMYNSNRPVSGSFAIEDHGTALRELAWGQYKKRVDRWLYWESTYYENFQCPEDSHQALTNVFQQGQTFGCFESFDEVFGETGWNYLNGDGVLFYPGTDRRFPLDSYGVMGPFASLRLKHWRRGIQDVDYLTMAAAIDPAGTAAILERMVPEVLWEVGVEELEDPTYVLTDSSWPQDPDAWEQARAELAVIISAAAASDP